MKAKNCTIADLKKTLRLINFKFQNNIIFREISENKKGIKFTLQVKDCNGSGSSHSTSMNKNGSYRRKSSACWHVHGVFFDVLIKTVNQNAVVYPLSKKLSYDPENRVVRHNWEDWPVNLEFNASMLCDCEGSKLGSTPITIEEGTYRFYSGSDRCSFAPFDT